MKTAMKILIDYAIDKYGSDSEIANDLICKAMILIKEEKEQIANAFYAGADDEPLFVFASNYYEQTYKK
jgi:hypothetical protein